MPGAKVKCSNCGAELANLTFGWGKWRWLGALLCFLPVVAFVMWTDFWLFRPHREYVDELEMQLIETRSADDRFDVLGRLNNRGTHTWDRITVEAEIYDSDGKFLDEASDYITAALPPGAEEHFRLTIRKPDPSIRNGDIKVVLKVADADRDRI